MSAEKPSVTTESSDIVTSTITSVVLLFDCLKRTFLTVAVTYFSQRDTECSYYFALMLQMTFPVLLSYREIPFIMMQSTQSDVGFFTAIWIGWGLS